MSVLLSLLEPHVVKPKEGASISGARAVEGCDPLRKCWELIGPLQSAGAAMLLVAEPSTL